MTTVKQKYTWLIWVVSLAIPVVVAILYLMPKSNSLARSLDVLPAVNATLNAITSLFLISGYIFIRRKNKSKHMGSMYAALLLSVLFLISYVAYHATHENTTYGGEGWIRGVYYFILITHIILAAVIVPLVLITFVRALNERFDKHKKIARITLPLWLYVTITGVIVYFMISPYYGS
jgi:putative membrane protein